MRKALYGVAFVFAILAATIFVSQPALAGTAAEIDREVKVAMENLLESNPAAKKLSEEAKGILVFPNVVKGGFMIGGQYGEGALLVDGKTVGYYNTVEASYGLQAGAQTFGYALFFMKESVMKDALEKEGGFEVGVGPTIVVADEGLSKSLTTTTARADIYYFYFGQKGLMGGLGIRGAKITKITPDE